MKLFLKFIFCFFALNVYSQATCEIYFIQNNSDTPDIDLSHLRIKAGVNVIGSCLKAPKDTMSFATIRKFISVPDNAIDVAFRNSMQKKFNNNLDTNAMVMLDMESPVHPKNLEAVGNSDLLDSLIIYGFKRRIEIARAVLPKARLGLYGIVVPDGQGNIYADQLKGLLHAKKLGMFDSLDFICPVLYPRWHGSQAAGNVFSKCIRNTMTYVADSLNCGKDVVPLLSTIIYNKKGNPAFDGKWLDATRAQAYIDTLQKFPQVSAIGYWIGQPYDQSTNYAQWIGWRDSIKNYFSDSLSLLPVAGFTYNQVGNTISFTGTSLKTDSVRWKFGDKTGSSKTSPVHTYTANGTYTIRQIVFKNGYCPDTITAIIIVNSISVGISGSEDLNKIILYPNPTPGPLTIKFEEFNPAQKYKVSICNTLGEPIKEVSQISTAEFTFSVDELPKGIYILQIEMSGEIITVKKLIRKEEF